MAALLDASSPVREGQGFELARLEGWLAAHTDLRSPLSIEQFGRGFSNLTYLLRAGAREVVLRRAPPGVTIKSAHDMGREFRILSKLAPHWSKAPAPIAHCDDPAVIGTPFYLMERVKGVILRAKPPKDLTLDEARMKAASTSLVDTLAEIHGVDLAKVGLADLGKPEGYARRQVDGWTARYRNAQTDEVPQMDALAAWLQSNLVEAESAADAPALIHNDFKFDNVVLDADSVTAVVAVLDWEMATIGDPLLDLGTTLGYWIEPDDPPVFQVMVFGPTNLPGALRRVDIVERWQEKTGRIAPPARVLFAYAQALFKLAVVAQQLYRRWKDGLTKEERYAMMLEGVRAVASSALVAIDKGRIDRLG